MRIYKILLTIVLLAIQVNVVPKSLANESTKLTEKQAKALQLLNESKNKQLNGLPGKHQHRVLRLKLSELKDNQGQVYIGAYVNRADLLPYLDQLKEILGEDYDKYREFQAARDHQSFHMTLISPPEFKFADKTLLESLTADTSNAFTNYLQVTLLGLGEVALNKKKTFFVVAQSNDAQLIRQRFMLKNKDFHVTLGFKPSDIYGVKKDSSTLIK